jgi:hypothetical protein
MATCGLVNPLADPIEADIVHRNLERFPRFVATVYARVRYLDIVIPCSVRNEWTDDWYDTVSNPGNDDSKK